MKKEETKQETVTLEVYDPAMCCSTGVCGPDVDDALADFASSVKWLKSQGIRVARYNLGQEPEAFKKNIPVLSRLKEVGTGCLPIMLVDGEIVSEGRYPNREALAEWLNINEGHSVMAKVRDQAKQNIMTPQVQQLVALGAALASNSESSLKHHFNRAKELGLEEEEIAKALQIAQNVKQQPAADMVELSNRLLGAPESSSNGCTSGSGCC